MNEAATADRDALLAERAEAEAQLRAAEATLGLTPGKSNGSPDDGQEPEEPVQKPLNVEAQDLSVAELDVEALREAAARARQADEELALAASETSGVDPLGSAESASARVLEIREGLSADWRRLVGALISATGMAIVVGALGWNVYWLLVPIALIAVLTVDLRLSGKSAREAAAEAAQELAAVGAVEADGTDPVRLQRTTAAQAEARLAAARAAHDAAYERFEELAPGRRPSEVEEIIAEYEAERAARAQARAEAEAARAQTEAGAEAARAQVEVEAEAARAEAEADAEAETEEPAAAETAPAPPGPEPVVPVTPTEWWFGTTDAPEAPAAAAAPVRALAERLSAEGRDALARIQAQLDALDRVELAKKSLEWHEANGSAEPADAREST